MSPLESTDTGRGVYVEKPKSNIFTVMLLLSLLAILMAIVMLCMEMAAYDWDVKASGVALNTASPAHHGQPPQVAVVSPSPAVWYG